MTSFWTPEACGQTVLPGRSTYATFLGNFNHCEHDRRRKVWGVCALKHFWCDEKCWETSPDLLGIFLTFSRFSVKFQCFVVLFSIIQVIWRVFLLLSVGICEFLGLFSANIFASKGWEVMNRSSFGGDRANNFRANLILKYI